MASSSIGDRHDMKYYVINEIQGSDPCESRPYLLIGSNYELVLKHPQEVASLS